MFISDEYLAKKATTPTAVDSDRPDHPRELLPSAFLLEEAGGSLNSLPARSYLESLSEQGLTKRPIPPHLQYPPVPSCYALAECPTSAPNQWRLAQIQQTQLNIMEAELTAMHSKGENLSRERVLNTLKGANMLLESIQLSLMPDTRLSMSLQVPRYTEGVPIRSGSPEARLTLPSARPFTFSGSLSSTGPHQFLGDAGTPQGDAMSLENPGLVLAVPNVPSHSSLNSPRKSVHSESQAGFKPFPTTFSIPTFHRDVIRPVFRPNTLPSSRVTGPSAFRDTSVAEKQLGCPHPHLYPPSIGGGLPTSISLREKIACDHLTSFLRQEIASKGDSGLVRILHGMEKKS